MKQVHPKTQAVLDAYMDLEAPEVVRRQRNSKLYTDWPKLHTALEELVKSVSNTE